MVAGNPSSCRRTVPIGKSANSLLRQGLNRQRGFLRFPPPAMVWLATFRSDPFQFDSAFHPTYRVAWAQYLDAPFPPYGVGLLQ